MVSKKSKLEFSLHSQVFLQILAVSQEKAVSYCRRHLASFVDKEDLFSDLSQLMGLFALSPGQRDLFLKNHQTQSRNLASEFKKEALELYSLPQEGHLIQMIQTGAAALKTIYCVDGESVERECATCDPIVRMIAKNLPTGHTRQS